MKNTKGLTPGQKRQKEEFIKRRQRKVENHNIELQNLQNKIQKLEKRSLIIQELLSEEVNRTFELETIIERRTRSLNDSPLNSEIKEKLGTFASFNEALDYFEKEYSEVTPEDGKYFMNYIKSFYLK